jgi:hypothetical protein
VVHELGHWLEDGASFIRAKAYDFYERRTAGEKLQRLSTVTGRGYSSNERTRLDKFIEPYMGKDYMSRWGKKNYRYATEILSMGLEMFYKDPYRLASEDPEYFNFVLSVVRGNIK